MGKLKNALNGVNSAVKTAVSITVAALIGDAVACTFINECEGAKALYNEYNATTMVKDQKKHFWSKQTYTEVYVRNGKPVHSK